MTRREKGRLRYLWLKAIQAPTVSEAKKLLGPEQAKRLPPSASAVLSEPFEDIELITEARPLATMAPLKTDHAKWLLAQQTPGWGLQKRGRRFAASLYLEQKGYLLSEINRQILALYSEGLSREEIMALLPRRQRGKPASIRAIGDRIARINRKVARWMKEQREALDDSPEED